MHIAVRGVTKLYGDKVAVNNLTFDVLPGVVTGFLGPNGSGKSTTMRCMLGLDRADGGSTTFDGVHYTSLHQPLTRVGALLDAGYVHPGRTARNHLRWMAASNSLPRSRVDEVLDIVGLSSVANKRARTFSLGMRQRLGLASVLLGDPQAIILDEPANGLDPEGIRWIRDVLVHYAALGKTILVSSHLLSEMALMATSLIVIGRGQLLEQCTVDQLVAKYGDHWVRVKSPEAAKLAESLTQSSLVVTCVDANTLDVRGADAATVGERASQLGVVLHQLSPETGSLEDAFLKATTASQEYRTDVR
jgi:ABC-2 type transport system ATP-binding protein